MSSAFFRRPGDSSSDSDSDSDSVESEAVNLSNGEREEVDGAEIELTGTATTESLSSSASVSAADGEDNNGTPNVDQYRNLMLATLLEDFYRTRAAELMNTSNIDANYHRQSPEVQPLATKLYDEASRALSLNGLLPTTFTTNGLQATRRRFLFGLDNLGLLSVQDSDLLPAQPGLPPTQPDTALAIKKPKTGNITHLGNVLEDPMQSLVLKSRQSSMAGAHSDKQLSHIAPQRSHYESSFHQVRLLGKGGFGRVYHAYNVFDKNEYAIKKIPLSSKLSQRYQASGHEELESVLREVQALAQLDHSNVVRYHATWIEEPRTLPSVPFAPSLDIPGARLLKHSPAPLSRRDDQRQNRSVVPSDLNDGIVFANDSVSHRSFGNIHRVEDRIEEWTSHDGIHETSSAHDSDIFTDGNARSRSILPETVPDDSVYVLHVQMSMYPMTLAEYLAPAPANATSAPSNPVRRHCFHLFPALRILLGILCGLQYIHSKGLVHRDIKPSNIFISSSPFGVGLIADGYHDVGSCRSCPYQSSHYVNPRIGDFGLVAELARSINLSPASSPASSNVVGTEYYRPPVALDPKGKMVSRAIDEKIDVFALGVILVEMLWCCNTRSERLHVLQDIQKGRLPRGLAAKIDAEGHEPGIGSHVERCIRGMIHSDAGSRWSCTRVKECVDGILANGDVKQKPEDTHADHDGQLRKIRSLEGTEIAEDG